MEEILVARCAVLSKNRQKLLLVKRAANDRHSPGLWECLGGKAEGSTNGSVAEREMLLKKTAEDEVWQESGLRLQIQRDFFEVDRFEVTEGPYAGRRYVCFFAVAIDYSSARIVLSEEHDECVWVSYSDALEYDLTQQTRKGLIALEKFLIVPA